MYKHLRISKKMAIKLLEFYSKTWQANYYAIVTRFDGYDGTNNRWLPRWRVHL